MSILVSKYTLFDELRCLLRDMNGASFIVPTSDDSEWLLGLAGHDDDCVFPDLRTYVWNSLYRELAGRADRSVMSGIRIFRQIDPPDNMLILKHIVSEYTRNKSDVLSELPGIVHTGYIDMLSDSLRELISEEVSPEILEMTALNPDLSRQALFEIYGEYISYLDKNGLMDSAQIPTRAKELIEDNRISIKGEKFAFVGFLSFTSAQKSLIETMSNKGADVTLIQPEAFVEGIYDASAQFVKYKNDGDNKKDTRQSHSKNYYLYETPDTLCELDLLAKELALWRQKRGAFAGESFEGWDAVGILTSQGRIKTLCDALSRYNIPVNLDAGKRVSETPLGYLYKKVFSACKNGWQTKDTAMLLAHVCLGGSISSPEMMSRGPAGERGWMKFLSETRNSIGIKAFNAMLRFCSCIDEGGNPAKILKVLFDFAAEKDLWADSLRMAAALDKSGVFDSAMREIEGAASELERKLLFMEELRPSIGGAGNQIYRGFAALDFLNQWAEESRTAAAPHISGAVSVYSQIPALANFDILIITGVTAKEWPGNLLNSSLVGDTWRESINEYNRIPGSKPAHMATLREKRVQKEALLKRLFYSSRRFTVVSRPLADDKNRPLMESPCLASASEPEDFIKVGTARKSFSDLLPIYSPSVKKRDVPVGISKGSDKVKISLLDELSECPFLYWARDIEKIKEPVTELYNSALAGNLAHDVMEAAWREKAGKSLYSVVSSLWDKIENNEEESLLSDYRELFSDRRLLRRKNLLKARLIKVAELQDGIEARIADYAEKRTDIKFEHDVSFDMEGVSFTGRCDRLDIFDGGVVIIDYKTGKIPKSVIQLGGYAKALKMSGVEILGAGYLSLKDEKLAGVFKSPYSLIYTGKENKKNVAELIDETEQKISTALQSLKRGEFRPNYNSSLCLYCPYTPLCRHAEFNHVTEGL